MAKTVVGVDIGSDSVRAVEVRGGEGERPAIVRRHEIALPEDAVRRGEVVEVSTVATALRRLWSAGGLKSKDVVLGMGGQRVFARDLVLPDGTLEQIREALPFQVQELLPVPVSDVILDFYPISREERPDGPPQVNGLLVAALKDTVDVNVRAALEAGLRPVHVDLVPFALSRAITPVRSTRGNNVLVSIGADSTDVVVVSDGVPTFVRMIATGGGDITRALVARLQWTPEQAEQAKRAIGMGAEGMRPEDRPVLEVVYQVVGEQLAGIRNTLSYYAGVKPSAPVERILLTGGGARLSGFAAALADHAGLPVFIANPLAASEQRASEPSPFAVAYGLALGSHS